MLSLFPKNEIFFDFFLRAAEAASRASDLMLELCKSPERAVQIVGAIRETEHRGDEVTRECMRHLVRSFITPLDREDIHYLCSSLDDVIDSIDDSAASFLLLKIGAPLPEFVKQAELLAQATRTLKEIFALLQNPKQRMRIQVLVRKVDELESEADGVYSQTIARLFNEEKDAITIMKWKELCEFLEEAIDSCQNVADTVENAVLKNL